MTRQKGTDFACDMCYKYGKNGNIGRTINLWSKRLTHQTPLLKLFCFHFLVVGRCENISGKNLFWRRALVIAVNGIIESTNAYYCFLFVCQEREKAWHNMNGFFY